MKNNGLILFDIDGLIGSVEKSYRPLLRKTVYKFSSWEPNYQDIDRAKKKKGSVKNNWDLSSEFIKKY